MISSIIDLVLLVALAATSGCVLLMYRRLQRFDALQGQAAREFARSSEALDKAREAIAKLQADGGQLTVSLANRLNEARLVINDIEEATTRTSAAFAAREAVAETAGATLARQGTARATRSAAASAREPGPEATAAASGRRHAPADDARAVGSAPELAEEAGAAADMMGQPSAAARIRAAAGVTSPPADMPSAPSDMPASGPTTRRGERDAGHGNDPERTGEAGAARQNGTGQPGTDRQRATWTAGRWASRPEPAQPVMSRWATAAAAQTRGQHQSRPAVRTVNWTQIARAAPGA